MYNSYQLHRSTANYKQFQRSQLQTSLITDVLKPSFLLNESRNNDKNSVSRIQVPNDYSKYHFSEEVTKKMTFIDCNPFHKSSQVHLQPIPYKQRQLANTYFDNNFVQNNKHINQSFVSELIPVTESILNSDKYSHLSIAKQSYQKSKENPEDRQRERRIEEILQQIDKSSNLFKAHSKEDKQYEQYNNHNQDMYTKNIMDYAQYQQSKFHYPQQNNQYEPATHDQNNLGRQTYSIINKLSSDHYQNKQHNPFAKQYEEQQNDPATFWKKQQSQYNTGTWPPQTPHSITLRGVNYQMIPIS